MNQNPDVHVINKLIFKKTLITKHNLNSFWILANVTTDYLEESWP